MSKKNKGRGDGLVFSTNKDFYNDYEEESLDGETLEKKQQKLRVRIETKHRAGKVVTIVANFVGSDEDRKALGKELKTKCGTGGSVKDGEIIVQGDYKMKIISWLKDWGYALTK